MREHEQMSYDLEQGLDTISSEDGYNADNATNLSVLRTRSTVNLSSSEGSPEVEDNFGLERGNSNINLNGGRYTPNFLNKPFAVPKKSPVGVFLFQDNNGSRESLSRSLSSTSLKKTKE